MRNEVTVVIKSYKGIGNGYGPDVQVQTEAMRGRVLLQILEDPATGIAYVEIEDLIDALSRTIG